VADVQPFCGLRYNVELIKDITAVISPPYDIISAEEQKETLINVLSGLDGLIDEDIKTIVKFLGNKNAKKQNPIKRIYQKTSRTLRPLEFRLLCYAWVSMAVVSRFLIRRFV